ncbi:hypothetical protein AVEN_35872-1 [Araneus ventricosus]|uniref:Uncharacterized protein n=1 Tax=Araneus ventricosus TaxID=182803 RepID=A0A4Y2BMD2_ARAVE|nr:hypothetical protein AVEN_35872-1 [Araneus ventricosus]
MKCSLVQRISKREYVSLVELMPYLNFGRKYDAAAVTVDFSRLPNKNALIQQAKIVMTRFLASKTNHSPSLRTRQKTARKSGGEIFNVVRKIRKSDPLKDKDPTLFNLQEF